MQHNTDEPEQEMYGLIMETCKQMASECIKDLDLG